MAIAPVQKIPWWNNRIGDDSMDGSANGDKARPEAAIATPRDKIISHKYSDSLGA